MRITPCVQETGRKAGRREAYGMRPPLPTLNQHNGTVGGTSRLARILHEIVDGWRMTGDAGTRMRAQKGRRPFGRTSGRPQGESHLRLESRSIAVAMVCGPAARIRRAWTSQTPRKQTVTPYLTIKNNRKHGNKRKKPIGMHGLVQYAGYAASISLSGVYTLPNDRATPVCVTCPSQVFTPQARARFSWYTAFMSVFAS